MSVSIRSLTVAGAAACLLLFPSAASRAGVPPTAAFDYSVKERFALPPLGTGLGAEAGEIYTDPVPALGMENAFIDPAAFEVDFDACGSMGLIDQYHWNIDGNPAGTETGCADFSFAFTTLGMHTVSLTVVDSLQNEGTTARAIDVRDWLIVALGDSVASGEGVPDLPIGQQALDLAGSAQMSFDDAQSTADAALLTLQDAIGDLAQLQADVNAALALQQEFVDAIDANDSCGNPIECLATAAALVTATDDFVQALADLGLDITDPVELADPFNISATLDGLIATAIMRRDAAQSASDSAQALLAVAQADLDGALAALEPTWRNRRCHRSALSGQVQAAAQLARSDPHSSVTFIHLPCSGATIETGLIGPYDGIEPIELNETTGMLGPPSIPLPAQIERARELVCGASCDGSDRKVDGFLLSIGANDVNFGEIIETCIVGEPCFDDPIPDGAASTAFDLLCAPLGPFTTACDDFHAGLSSFDAQSAFLNGLNEPPANGLDDLPSHFGSLQAALTGAFGAGAAARVLLTEYPDVTRDESGAFCGWEANQSIGEQLMNLPGVSPGEMMSADTIVQAQLAAAMQNAATLHGWSFVGGLAAAFATHGYCASDNWITRVQDSFRAQGASDGTLHPTQVGQLAYRDALLVALPEPGAPRLAAAALLTLAMRVRRLRLRSPGRDASPSTR